MDDKRAIFVSTASQVAVRLIGLIVSLASVKLLASAYGLAGTGIYNTITTYLTFCVVLADLGIFSVAVREIAKDPARERRIVANVLSLRLVSAAMAAIMAAAVISLTGYPTELVRGTEIASIFIFFNLVASSFDIVFQYRLKMQYSAAAELMAKLVSLAVLWTAIALHAGFFWAVASIPASGLAILLGKAAFSERLLFVTPQWDTQLIRWILRLSLPLGAVYVINNLYFKIDTLVLFALKGAAAVGIYSVAYKVLEVTVFIGSYFASSLKPALTRGGAESKRLVSRALIVMLLISLPVATVSSVFARPIILFLSNVSFVSGTHALQLLAWTLPFIYCNVLLGEALIARDASRQLLLIAGGSLACNLLLDGLLIPPYSYDGAAVATIASEIVLLAANLVCCRSFMRPTLPPSVIIRLTACTFVAASGGELLLRLPLHFLFGIFLTLALFALSAFGLQLITVEELRSMGRKTA